MLDLFGGKLKKDLENLAKENQELKKQVESLTTRLEKQEEKVRKAAATKQSVEEELKDARQKIESLESELSIKKVPSVGEVDKPAVQTIKTLSRQELDELLFFIGSMESKYSSLVTICTAPDERFHNTQNYIDPNTFLRIDKIESQTGKVVFYAPDLIQIVIIPPVPISVSLQQAAHRFDVRPLKEAIERDISLCVLTVHAGESFIGIADTTRFLEHEIIKSSVMGRHSKGGWSQKRFERLVDEDIRHHIQKVKESLGPMLNAHDTDFIIASGEKQLINQILEEYPGKRTLLRPMDIDISKQNLDQILRIVWSSRLYIL